MKVKQAIDANRKPFFVGLIFFLTGLLFFSIGLESFFVVKSYQPVDAVITRIDMESDDDSDYHDVYVQYDVDGETYDSKLDTYSSDYYVGKEIQIRYNPENPNEVTGSDKRFASLFTAIGSFILLIGVFAIVYALRSNRKQWKDETVSNNNSFTKGQTILVFVCLLIAPLLLIGIGVGFQMKRDSFQPANAVISRMIRTQHVDDSESYRVFVQFTVDGETYESSLDSYSSSYYVGKAIRIYYNPENPNEVTAVDSSLPKVLIVIGILLLIIEAVVAGFIIRKQITERRKRLEE